MVLGCYFVLTRQYNLQVSIIALIPFFLINNLLLLNQFPDMSADSNAGRKHLLIQYGVNIGLNVYALFILLAVTILLVAVATQLLPFTALIATFLLLACFIAFWGVKNNLNNIAKLKPYLAINVFAAISTPVVLALSILSN